MTREDEIRALLYTYAGHRRSLLSRLEAGIEALSEQPDNQTWENAWYELYTRLERLDAQITEWEGALNEIISTTHPA